MHLWFKFLVLPATQITSLLSFPLHHEKHSVMLILQIYGPKGNITVSHALHFQLFCNPLLGLQKQQLHFRAFNSGLSWKTF